MPTTLAPAQSKPKKVSHLASIIGSILAVISLLLSGFAYALVHLNDGSHAPTDGDINKQVGHAVDTVTTTVLGGLFGGMFSAFAIALAIAAIIFIALRMRKVKLGGLLFSLAAGALAIWSFVISYGVFDLIKAH